MKGRKEYHNLKSFLKYKLLVQLDSQEKHGLFKCVTVFREPIFSLKDGLQIQAVHHEWHSFTGLGRGIR